MPETKPELLAIDVDNIDDVIYHYGTKRHSGRYPWGSGETPYQHSGDFLSACLMKEREGLSQKEIADQFNLTIDQYRVAKAAAKHQRNERTLCEARKLMKNGMSRNAAAKQLGIPESTLRAFENEQAAYNRNAARQTANILKEAVEKKGIIDVGDGVESELGISKTKLKEAIYILTAEEGYSKWGIGVKNPSDPTGRNQTNTTVLYKDPEVFKAAYADNSLIQSVADYHSKDGGETFNKLQYPSSIDSSRILVRYAEDGGLEGDGCIELRRGVPDLDMGKAHYAQVRILTDGSHYLKGMAQYSDDIPEGKDIVFNTNKKRGTPMIGPKDNSVLKPIKNDPDNPFGAMIKSRGQSTYIGKDGKEHLSPINKLKEEGDWAESAKNLSSQWLSKQPTTLIKQQLQLSLNDYMGQFEVIQKMANPTVRRKLLNELADNCDAAAVHMKAAALPRQQTHVILPVPGMSDKEVYAPNYADGEHVVLVRFPYGGPFESPELVVNNKIAKARKSIGVNARDAIGISARVAEQLSGADFDGDTVVVIPQNDKVKIRTAPQLKGLKGFDPKEAYPYRPGMSVMPEKNKQKEMGIISNLITDMTLKGASKDEIAAAVRHSMTVIDAPKHRLDYKQSEIDNGIDRLKKIYQDGGGASTLLSKRKQPIKVPERRGSARVDPETGKLTYHESGRYYDEEKPVRVKDPTTGKMVDAVNPETGKTLYRKTGKKILAMQDDKLLAVTEDLHTLSSGTPQEELYANYGNSLKALANRARKEMMATERLEYKPEANQKYKQEVASLKAKLDLAHLNKPRERQALAKANGEIRAKKMDNPDMSKDEIKKLKTQALQRARDQVGASGKDSRVNITDKEWEAIQAGAIHDTTLTDILRFADPDRVKELAMPKESVIMSPNAIARMKSLMSNGYTNQEIAKALGVSTSTIGKYSAEIG